MQTVSVTVDENQAIVATAANGTAMSEYWVRCLPHDFPPFRWEEHGPVSSRPPGYYLLGELGAPTGSAYALVLDENGVPVWYHHVPSANGAFNVASLVKGTISFTPWTSHASPYEIRQLAPWMTTYVTAPHRDEHELRVLSNGDYLLIADPLVSGVDLTGLTLSLPDGGVVPLGANQYILDCNVVEVDPKGTVVWQWSATDHLDPAKASTWPQLAETSQTAADGGLIIDTFHCNAIDVDPKNDNLLISARGMDSIFYVEKASGRVTWKMGGSVSTKDDAVYVPVVDPFRRQHDARLQPDWVATCTGGSGQISLFDDETQTPGPSRAVVYDVRVASPDGGAGDCGVVTDAGGAGDGGATGATVAWQYRGKVPSATMGSFRISADGSRVIGWGLGGTPELVFTELDLAGNDVLDFYLMEGTGSYRAVKVLPSELDLGTLRATAGLP